MRRGGSSKQTSPVHYHGSKTEPKKKEIKQIIKNIFHEDT